jgi:hypothetical protein
VYQKNRGAEPHRYPPESVASPVTKFGPFYDMEHEMGDLHRQLPMLEPNSISNELYQVQHGLLQEQMMQGEEFNDPPVHEETQEQQ